MDEKLKERVARKEALVILTAADGSVLWECGKSPVSGLCKAWFGGQLPREGYGWLYAEQLGAALAMFAARLGVGECWANRLSDYGLQELEAHHIPVTFAQRMHLVHSSKDESKVCPVEQFLADHPDEAERWRFLESQAAGGASCSLSGRDKG